MSTRLVPAAARAFALFEIFAREKRELSNAELAKNLDLPESSCSNLVNTLIDIGYLGRSHQTRRLYPTGRLIAIAREIDKNDIAAASLNDACERVRNRTGESALCGSLHGQVVTVVAFSPGHQPLRYTSARGDRLSLHVSALGKAILTRMPPEDVPREIGSGPYEKVASATITDPGELVRQVGRLRKLGYVHLENEGADGLATIAIAGRVNGQLLGFSIAGAQPTLRQRRDEFLAVLHEVCDPLFDTAAA
ncbi:helix-turn-helix domain-containing protein [Ramlibacter sp. G-1-2-2]|uniref:Helix-turn-helix domain-containing protein n=1 Tax=Ramlibacter agri TaxID=2728837 RepID=A0A848HLU1_9BURK|nr:IclR family transcriptional regulator C-terminal domain-containing protein [Ramlibacter agri]NML48718.1 helix-turn-helix domain-containing protein [Ramlibacter agri]